MGSRATKATLLLQRGRRYAFEKEFTKAVKDFDDTYALVEDECEREVRDRERLDALFGRPSGNGLFGRGKLQ